MENFLALVMARPILYAKEIFTSNIHVTAPPLTIQRNINYNYPTKYLLSNIHVTAPPLTIQRNINYNYPTKY